MQTPDATSLFLQKRVIKLMGNRFEISVVTDDKNWAEKQIDKAVNEISRIEQLLTTFNESSQTNQINANAGIKPIAVDKEVFDLIRRSLKISALTQGAFDISYGSIDKRFWNFDTHMTVLPDKEIAKRSVQLINYRNIILEEENYTVFLKQKGMRIGFGGIGKGYAAEMAKKKLLEKGVGSGIINASGDLTAWGMQPDGRPWRIGISNPDRPQDVFSYMDISGKAVATSGN